MPDGGTPSRGTIDEAEIQRFAAMAEAWWDPHGKFRPLHRFNPTRLAYIRNQVVAHFRRAPEDLTPLAGLSLVDIGCGGGLVSEPMARLGAAVTGLDAAEANIGVARLHAEQGGLAIDYRAEPAEALAEQGARFDVVLALEVIEHVADRALFLAASSALVKPGGLLIAATLNRSAKAYALAIVGAEYVLGWLPRGTHDWRKFVKPSELASGLRQNGLMVGDLTGIVYNPLADEWHLARDVGVNYMMCATKGPMS
jgi:2-polyprenyl-6-hydroxyphenyl methylase/3-demethylubiquinone-9 3-methyltransferase